jgi:hypothetical protein
MINAARRRLIHASKRTYRTVPSSKWKPMISICRVVGFTWATSSPEARVLSRRRAVACWLGGSSGAATRFHAP